MFVILSTVFLITIDNITIRNCSIYISIFSLHSSAHMCISGNYTCLSRFWMVSSPIMNSTSFIRCIAQSNHPYTVASAFLDKDFAHLPEDMLPLMKCWTVLSLVPRQCSQRSGLVSTYCLCMHRLPHDFMEY